jgi:hypothetical protein
MWLSLGGQPFANKVIVGDGWGNAARRVTSPHLSVGSEVPLGAPCPVEHRDRFTAPGRRQVTVEQPDVERQLRQTTCDAVTG